MIRSACKEDFPQDCDDIWESENNKFRFNIVCGKKKYYELHFSSICSKLYIFLKN